MDYLGSFSEGEPFQEPQWPAHFYDLEANSEHTGALEVFNGLHKLTQKMIRKFLKGGIALFAQYATAPGDEYNQLN